MVLPGGGALPSQLQPRSSHTLCSNPMRSACETLPDSAWYIRIVTLEAGELTVVPLAESSLYAQERDMRTKAQASLSSSPRARPSLGDTDLLPDCESYPLSPPPSHARRLVGSERTREVVCAWLARSQRCSTFASFVGTQSSTLSPLVPLLPESSSV